MTPGVSRSHSFIGRWTGASVGALRSFRRHNDTAMAGPSAKEVEPILDAAAAVAASFAQRTGGTEGSQALANAASICRWELLVLRERILQLGVTTQCQALQAEIVRHLEDAAAAARVLSSGYRFHSLDRICEGGQALDDHLEALERLRTRSDPGA